MVTVDGFQFNGVAAEGPQTDDPEWVTAQCHSDRPGPQESKELAQELRESLLYLLGMHSEAGHR